MGDIITLNSNPCRSYRGKQKQDILEMDIYVAMAVDCVVFVFTRMSALGVI